MKFGLVSFIMTPGVEKSHDSVLSSCAKGAKNWTIEFHEEPPWICWKLGAKSAWQNKIPL